MAVWEQLRAHFGNDRRNLVASHSTCANIKRLTPWWSFVAIDTARLREGRRTLQDGKRLVTVGERLQWWKVSDVNRGVWLWTPQWQQSFTPWKRWSSPVQMCRRNCAKPSVMQGALRSFHLSAGSDCVSHTVTLHTALVLQERFAAAVCSFVGSPPCGSMMKQVLLSSPCW